MLQVESKITEVNASNEHIYNFLADFNNFSNLMPPQVTQWKADENTCSFIIQGLPELKLEYKEKTPYSLIVITPQSLGSVSFYLGITLQNVSANSSTVITYLNADVNPMMKMMLQNPLQNFVNTLSEKLGLYFESHKK